MKEKLSDAQTREVFDVSVYVGDTHIGKFGTAGKVTIGLPYALKSGEVSSNVWVDHIDIVNDAVNRMVDGRGYTGGKTIFETDHLSIYAVVYDAKAAPASGSGGSGGGCDAGLGVFALLAACGVAVMKKR